jgi:hypothetical protein
LRRRLYKFVWTVRQNGMPVLCDNITLKAWEIVRMLNIKCQEFKVSRRCVLYECCKKRGILYAKDSNHQTSTSNFLLLRNILFNFWKQIILC